MGGGGGGAAAARSYAHLADISWPTIELLA